VEKYLGAVETAIYQCFRNYSGVTPHSVIPE
jgi:hypothetical protein